MSDKETEDSFVSSNLSVYNVEANSLVRTVAVTHFHRVLTAALSLAVDLRHFHHRIAVVRKYPATETPPKIARVVTESS